MASRRAARACGLPLLAARGSACYAQAEHPFHGYYFANFVSCAYRHTLHAYEEVWCPALARPRPVRASAARSGLSRSEGPDARQCPWQARPRGISCRLRQTGASRKQGEPGQEPNCIVHTARGTGSQNCMVQCAEHCAAHCRTHRAVANIVVHIALRIALQFTALGARRRTALPTARLQAMFCAHEAALVHHYPRATRPTSAVHCTLLCTPSEATHCTALHCAADRFSLHCTYKCPLHCGPAAYCITQCI